MASAFDLFTVGHSNHPLDHFLGQLRANGVTCIADVRSRPFSRRFPWFSQTQLASSLAATGIDYLSCGETLGGRPSDASLLRDGVADYEAVAATKLFKEGLAEAKRAAKQHRLCLMCAEREPLDCHRCLLVARALAADGLRVGHILADASVEPHDATEERLMATAKVGGDLLLSTREQRLAEAYRRRARAVAFRA